MLARHPLLFRSVVCIVLPLLVAVVVIYRYLSGSVAEYEGAGASSDISAQVQITRDRHGVAFIKASTDRDAFFALGYVHAQDRLWQLELQRRLAQGRLSEVFGRDSVNRDIWFRTLGLHRAAKASWPALSAEAQASLTSYAAGINAWIDSVATLPIEFTLLGVEPERWTAFDSLAWVKVFALSLGNNFYREITKMLAGEKLSVAQLDTLYPGYPREAPTTVSSAHRHERRKLVQMLDFQRQLQKDLKLGGRYAGSNAWAVSGRHTALGSSIIANDPHLQLQAPSLWYVVDIEGDKLAVSGMSLVGLPLVIFGRNQHIAWGGTAMLADVQDLYLEQPAIHDGNRYKANDSWRDFALRTEEIKIKADMPASLRPAIKPITIQVRSSRHGPIISDMFEIFQQPVALRWTALAPGDTSYEAFFRLNYAENWRMFNAAMSRHVAPALNMLYADGDGNIGYLGAGRIPVRRQGEGTLPVPGWNDDYQWTGYIPFAEMPREYNPDKGFIVNANNKVVSNEYPYFISHDWAPPARASRIEQLLQQTISGAAPLTVDDIKRIQADTLDLAARELLPFLTALRGETDTQQQIITQLSQWRGDMSGDSVSATVFYVWLVKLKQHIFDDELRGYWGEQAKQSYLAELVGSIEIEQVLSVLTQDRAGWCDNIRTAVIESCERVMFLALDDAVEVMRKLEGSDPSDWQWGKVHRAVYEHSPFSHLKILNNIFERRISNGGSTNTINVASAHYDEEKGFTQTFGPGFRQIMAWDKDSRIHWYMNSMGQSGNVMSPHYDDMLVPFTNVDYYDLAYPGSEDKARVLYLKPDNQAEKRM